MKTARQIVRGYLRVLAIPDEVLRGGIGPIRDHMRASWPMLFPKSRQPYLRKIWLEEVDIALELAPPARPRGRPKRRPRGIQLLLPLREVPVIRTPEDAKRLFSESLMAEAAKDWLEIMRTPPTPRMSRVFPIIKGE